jgi:hypothetical protein
MLTPEVTSQVKSFAQRVQGEETTRRIIAAKVFVLMYMFANASSPCTRTTYTSFHMNTSLYARTHKFTKCCFRRQLSRVQLLICSNSVPSWILG